MGTVSVVKRRIPAPVRRRVVRALHPPPRVHWPYAFPLLPVVIEARHRVFLRRAPVVTVEEHAARIGVKEIEEVIGCSLCGERRCQPLYSPTRIRKGKVKWVYHVVRCPSCGFLYRHPGIKPERLGDLYAGKYDKFLTGKYSSARTRRYKLVMKAFGPVLWQGEGRKLLDFGCGAGIFLDLALKRGFDPYGVDLSESSIETARAKPSGRNAYYGSPMDVPEIAAGGFDVACLWSVLAHLTSPVEDFTMLRGLLKDDGVLVVLTVNANSLALKLHRDKWNGFTPNHLKFFSPTTLPLLARRAGFGAIAFASAYGDTVESGTSSMGSVFQRVLRHNIDRGNRGNMMRALLFADPDGPARHGLDGIRL